MQKILICLFLVVVLFVPSFVSSEADGHAEMPFSSCQCLFAEMNLDSIVNYAAFEKAFEGYKKLNMGKNPFLTLIDFSKPSTEKRFYVFDMIQKKLLFFTYVAHGKNSGDNFATSFSNENGSHKSSLGFFRTENTYQGKSGYSLVIDGLEKEINDHAKERAIVIHGSPYCEPTAIKSMGRLGRSFGCPALPATITRSVIDTIKNGALLFIYANDEAYFKKTSVLT